MCHQNWPNFDGTFFTNHVPSELAEFCVFSATTLVAPDRFHSISVSHVATTTRNTGYFISCCHSGACLMMQLYQYARLKCARHDNSNSHVTSNCDETKGKHCDVMRFVLAHPSNQNGDHLSCNCDVTMPR